MKLTWKQTLAVHWDLLPIYLWGALYNIKTQLYRWDKPERDTWQFVNTAAPAIKSR